MHVRVNRITAGTQKDRQTDSLKDREREAITNNRITLSNEFLEVSYF